MSIIISSVRATLDCENGEIIAQAIKQYGITEQVKSAAIYKTSVDARHKNSINTVHSVLIELCDKNAERAYAERHKEIRLSDEMWNSPCQGSEKLSSPPIVIGFGPAGMFAAYVLALNGYRPIVVERGADIDKRTEKVEKYWQTGVLDTKTNIQFGEGGAGTFSDGKLVTRINDSRCSYVLQTLFENGAPKEILQNAKPHIGTDILRDVVKNIRKKIIGLGGTVIFEKTLTKIKTHSDGSVRTLVFDDGSEMETQTVILAVGHSARDTVTQLADSFAVEAKPFSVGVRVEQLQSVVDKSMYGDFAGHPKLPHGEYAFSERRGERCVYTFCMCPGGYVVASASEENTVVTNGMSKFARSGTNANAALVVSVSPKEFGTSHPLCGIEYQRMLEKAAFEAGGADGCAPIQLAEDFANGTASRNLKSVSPTYMPGTRLCDMNSVLPGDISDMLKLGLASFERKLKGFAGMGAVMTGFETRTSSPVRMLRGDTCEAVGHAGVYPCGEGAGYAGGITSAAVDGIRCAEQIIMKYSAD